MNKKAKENVPDTTTEHNSLPSAVAQMKTIKEVHDYYQKIISCMPNNVFWLDRDCITQGCNANVLKFVGLEKPEEFIGITYEQMGKIAGWTQGHAQLYEHDDQEVMASKKPKLNIDDPPILNPDGTLTYYSSSRVPLFDEAHKEVIGVVGISIDITEQKQLLMDLKQAKERAELANQAKTEFLANMRHDIRTPLSGIVGFSEILKSEATDLRIKEYADNLIASSHALLDLMDEVLDAIKVSSGEVPLLKKKFNLAETLENVTNLYSAKAAEKKITLSFNCNSELPSFVIGDRVRIHRIVLELVGNALNFTDSGHVTIHASQAKKEKRSLILQLAVTDTGMGIPKDKQQDIYVQFKRLTPSYQGIYKGAGLGLYVVKQFIDELGGEIYVKSEPHKGTVFTCLIPLQIPLLDNDAGVDTLDELKSPTLMVPLNQQVHAPQLNPKASSKILVVEDNFIAQTVVKTLLSRMDCAVDVASNGVDALALYENNKYDLIFMDIGLGEGIDGYEVTQQIRSKTSLTRHIPIIALTAHGADESKQRCIESGMDAVLTKPLTQAHATDILKSFIPEQYEKTAVDLPKTRKDLPDSDDEMFQLNQFPILSSEEALKNCATHEMLKELLTLMTQELPTDLECIKKAFKDLDYPLVEKTAHKIKGGAVYVGTIRMKYACQYVERYWKNGQRELFDALYHQAVSTIEETITYIEGWLQKNTSS